MPKASCFTPLVLALATSVACAASLSKRQPVDFFADVPSRNLQGLAARSDGRLVPGPAVGATKARFGTELLWSVVPAGNELLIGTGPDGHILQINPNVRGEFTPKVLADLPETHVFALARLANGDVLAGTSPQGTLVLLRNAKVLARVALPVDSIFDLAVIRDDQGGNVVLAATGNPGRIYRVDLKAFAVGGDMPEKIESAEALGARGITLFGEIRDRNIRRLLPLPDGRVIAGSAPRGNVYEFTAAGGPPRMLSENRNAEVTDLLAWDGGFFAALTFAAQPAETRVVRPQRPPTRAEDGSGQLGEAEPPPPAPPPPPVDPIRSERFTGRSQLLWFQDGGFPEVAAARNGVAFYRLQRHENLLLIAGGEQGELLGYDPTTQRSLTFAGATPAQLNGIVPAATIPGAYYAIGNNPTGLSLINFPGVSVRSAESRRIDLGVPAAVGAMRFGSGNRIDPARLSVELRTSYGSDESEGWTDWQRAVATDEGWRVPELRGRYVQARLKAETFDFEIDRAELHYLPQNRRPTLQEFRVLAPNYALIPSPESPPSLSTTLGQLMQPPREDDRRRTPLPSSQVVPQTGTQVVLWTVNDAESDNLLSSFSIRRVGAEAWTDLIVDTRNSYHQFDVSHLPEGVYQTRLVVTETEPRPAADRLSVTFSTDDLLIDRTPPEMLEAVVTRDAGNLVVTVRARDALSLMAGVEFTLNNGHKGTVEHPADGILDGREETFRIEINPVQAAGATAIELVVYDALGNSTARRLKVP
jgi:hypothetical protein